MPTLPNQNTPNPPSRLLASALFTACLLLGITVSAQATAPYCEMTVSTPGTATRHRSSPGQKRLDVAREHFRGPCACLLSGGAIARWPRVIL